MDIAALSTTLSQARIAQEVTTSVAKLALDTAKTNMNNTVTMMEQSVNPHIGSNFDLKL